MSFVQMVRKSVIGVGVLVLGFALVAEAQKSTWFTDVTNTNSYFAATVNDSNRVLGQYCYFSEDGCFWMISMEQQCVEGQNYPVLANVDSEAMALELVCFGKVQKGEGYLYAFTNFAQIDALLRKSTVIGVAVPVGMDAFVVVRFSLSGAVDALTTMLKAAESHRSTLPKNTKDKKL
jgi:hypothetical protein